jgi:hypothetical protein
VYGPPAGRGATSVCEKVAAPELTVVDPVMAPEVKNALVTPLPLVLQYTGVPSATFVVVTAVVMTVPSVAAVGEVRRV